MTVCDALVVAAGRGRRFGSARPKQYQPLAGQPVLRRTIEAFLRLGAVRRVQAVIAPDDRDLYEEAVQGLTLPPPVLGGDTRQASVAAGLEALADNPPDLVAIHDGARPLVPATVLDAALAVLARLDLAGAIAALPVSDALKRVEGGIIAGTVARDHLWRMQTPQVFRYDDIRAAHRAVAARGADEATALPDDAAVAELAGLLLAVVPGSALNLKITDPGDIELAARLLEAERGRMETRTGFGFDVHAFDEGNEVWLCGVRIPHDRKLAGHSDADVALHAATDAVLGAMAEDDIGRHFPPSDPRWRGADSAIFLTHAASLLRGRGGRLVHLDVTIICEAPRVGPHRDAMRARVAEICGIELARVSVKATTTERLGFTGRGEGIAAQAVATIEVPA
jgi:2-C-methyl-D-erythritol 4-phosphate cytidylyltransferase/2-C-methyl-D-erythritol 2,4-cyclodiphosphate synthase